MIVDPDGERIDAILVASPYPNTKHVLAITCVSILKLGPDPEIFLFHGGYDAFETMTDPTKQAGFLAFLYPLSEAADVRKRLGSVDCVPKS
jgi:hypothetical protein